MTPITTIHIEYGDGSTDDIEPLPDDNMKIVLYGWRRTRPKCQLPEGIYSTSAIAAFLFQSALAGHLTEYDSKDPKTCALIRDYAES